MTTHRFTVNVPNQSSSAVAVQLRLERAVRANLSGLQYKSIKSDLKVIHAGISLDSCAKEGKLKLALKLQPFASVDVHVIINTIEPVKPGVAAFNLVDRRGTKDVGGVLLVCTHPPVVEPLGQVVTTPRPCPAVLARGLYAIPHGGDPSNTSAAKPVTTGDSVDLVAQITNQTTKPLLETRVYLEHLGISNAEFTPGTWNVGTLNKGDVFYATWPIRTSAWQAGSFNASIVTVSKGMDPVRLGGKLKILAPKQVEKKGPG